MTLKLQVLSYTGVNILNSSIPFLLLPLLTVYLSPSDYGLLTLIQLVIVVSLPIVLMNTHGFLIIEYSKLPFEKFQSLVSTIVWVPIAGFVFLEIIFYFSEVYLVKYFHIPLAYIYYLPIFVLIQAVPAIVSIIFQAKKEPLKYGKYKISMTVFNFSLSLLLVVVFGYGWEGRLWGIVGSFLIFSLIGLIILIRLNYLKLSFDKELLRSALRFGIPAIPHSIAGVFLAMSDRIFLANMLGEGSVGIYSVAFQLASAVSIILSSINQAWSPYLFKKLNADPSLEDKIQIIKTTYKIMLLMTIMAFLFILFSSLIFDVFIDRAYHEGKSITRYVTVAFLFQGYYFMVTNYIFYSKKTYLLSYITLFSVFIIFVSNYFLIRIYGIYGAAYSMALAWAIFFFITWVVAQKIYPMPWRLK